MNRLKKINTIRQALFEGQASIGSWMQIPSTSVAEILGQAGYDWVAVDLEHGSISIHQLPDMFRALELGGTLPMVRLAHGQAKDCKQALDAGAGGIIVPMIETGEQLAKIRDVCCWPPEGNRGVGFSRANLFGKYFDSYAIEAQSPFLVAMIENIQAIDNLEDILEVKGLDAILIGPYDLSASMKLTAQFDLQDFVDAIQRIRLLCKKHNIPCGMHVVQPVPKLLEQMVKDGYQFIAYSIDAVFLNTVVSKPSF